MSIRDQNGEEVVRLTGPWVALFKLALAAMIPFTLSGLSLATWVVLSIFRLKETNSIQDLRIAMLERTSGASKGVSQSVNVGSTDSVAGDVDDAKTYMTTEDMAKKAGVAPRTILSWIADPTPRFEPMPIETSKGWVFDAKCRILPPNAASSGIATLSSTGEEKP
ncbi:MAG: hypothetical protein E6Q97_35360 [Desulfurellales bacterium]|nr:MAG: hypothetical protein E6Q97_35360 [Desulfurellales bacterium]